ncbi:hypothetical protein HM131_15625 [Halobacillus mangrovi]|uniref:Uncharacterized protein n=1 Tax=Halobacillus mangrovi TaxID=402384 RepID=A0A1W5ZY21_9BACI|nr:hypothetical protein HM131_15625 [Halobacillus mangrovi]
MGWLENGETPPGEGARRAPTESVPNEEACQFPRRKASLFPANPISYKVKDLKNLKLSVQAKEAIIEKMCDCKTTN